VGRVSTGSTAGSGGHFAAPVLLDLSGNGLSVDTLSSSSQFLDLEGDGYQHRTAWAGAGNGVLVLDADGDGKISRSSEFVFTEWDQTATGDLEALKSIFDTNHNGLLEAGDDRWSEFKVMVDGQLVSLASLGIASIGLTAIGSGQNFSDGSAITGTSQFTRTDGTNGAVGDAVLASDTNGYIIKSTVVTNGGGSRTTTLVGYDKDGTLAFQSRITVSADGLSKTAQFDDDGNGTYERSQTDVTTITAGVRQRVVSNFNTDGSLAERTTTTTSADKAAVTAAFDEDGDGANDQTQLFVKNTDGSTTTTVSEFSVNGTLLRKIATASSADGLTKTVQSDSTGSGVYDLVSTETTVVVGDGTRTKTIAETSSGGTLIDKEQTVTSADGRTRTVSHDLDGNGIYETRDVTAMSNGANGVSVTTVSSYSSTNALIGKSVATTSSDGLIKTVSTDLDGDGLFDIIASDVTVVGTGGSLTETQQAKSRDGSLLSSVTTNTSADRKTISIVSDADGDGHVDAVKTIAVDGAGVTTSIVSVFNPDGSLVGKTFDQTSADGLSLTSKADLNSDGVYDVTVTDVTTTDASSNRTRTVTTTSASGALIGSSAIITSADSLTQTVKDDLNADGTVDRTTVQATVLGGDGSRTVTTTTTSASGAMLARTEVKTSADRKTTTTKIDANGDTKIDRTQIATVNADGSTIVTVSDTDINGVQHFKEEKTVSANRLTVTDRRDVNGDGIYDLNIQAVTAIAASGTRTTTTSVTSSNGTLLSKTVEAVSANGLGIDTQIDTDGDGVVERKSSDVRVLNADGSVTRTVSALAGTGALIGKTITTTSANGLTSIVQADLDGNGTIDRSSAAIATLGADGSKTDTVTVLNSVHAQIARYQTVTSSNGNTVVTTGDLDGDGLVDETSSTVLNANGSTTTTNRTYTSGVLTSSAVRTVSANRLSNTLATDLDGNGTIDQSMADVTVLNADGSKTQTITDFDAAGNVKDNTAIVTSANGLTKTTTWAATGTTISRSMVDTTVLNADGSTTVTLDYKKANGSLESRTITTVSADKRTATTTRDVNGDGIVDITIASVTNSDGSITTTESGIEYSSQQGNKVTKESADGLSKIIDYHGYNPIITSQDQIDTKFEYVKTTDQDGSWLQTYKKYIVMYPDPFGSPASSELTLWYNLASDISGNGNVSQESSFGAPSSTNRVVKGADGSTVSTKIFNPGSAISRTFVTSDSANGLSKTISWDILGANPLSQDSIRSSTLNADGSTITTTANLKRDGSQLSKFVTTTTADGNTKIIQEDVDLVVGVDRTTIDNFRRLADGTTVESVRRLTTSSVLLDSEITTTSGNGRTISVARDADGDGTVDQAEVTTKAVDGSVSTLITNYSVAAHKSSETKIKTSADGLLTTSEWDFDGNGSVDQRRVSVLTIYANGFRKIVDTDTLLPSGALISTMTTTISADGSTKTVSTDVNGDGVTDRNEVTMFNPDGTVTGSASNNAAGSSSAQLIAGVVYWRQALPRNSSWTVSSDGLTSTMQADYDGNASYYPTISGFEYSDISQIQIDGSVVTTITEKNGSGVIVAKGTMTTSADGLTTTLLKDADNNGTYEHRETAVTRIDGSIRKVVTDYNASGVITQTVTTDVSADGRSTSVVTANATTGAGSTTGPSGVEFIAAGNTNDTITGSAGDDHIQGGAGNDSLNGGGGDDLLDGGTGVDIMKGNAGNDTYIVDDAGDQVIEAANEGIDTVLSSVTYTISDPDVENLTLTGTAAINGTGNASSNVLTGNSGDNSLTGNGGNDTFYGGAGNDLIWGGSGVDTFYGGAGNDYLNGGGGDDLYVFQRGDGSDYIEDFAVAATATTADISAAQALGVFAGGTVNTWVGGYIWLTSTNSLSKLIAAGTDTLALTGGIKADDLSFTWTGVGHDNLLISIAGGMVGDSVTLGQQAVAAGRIEKLTLDGLGTMNFAVSSTIGGTVAGTTASEILFGLSGGETIYGNGGNDIFYGGAGNDSLWGNTGNDTFYGGTGSDYENGAGGDDRYIFKRGDGVDYIEDIEVLQTSTTADINAAAAIGVSASGTVNTWVGGYLWQTSTNKLYKANASGTADTLVLTGGITASDLSFAWSGVGSDNLVISIAGGPAGDSVTLGQQAVANARIEKLQLDDLGTMNLNVARAAGATVNAGTGSNIIFGLSGNETLMGNVGNDTIYGGAGYDVIAGGAGDDTLIGGLGNDWMDGGDGSDRFVFRRGDGDDGIGDFSMVYTAATVDLNAAQAVGVSASGIKDVWVGGFNWQSSTNSLLKLVASTGVDTLSLEGGIGPDDLSFSWSGPRSEDLFIGIAGGPAGDRVRIYEQAVGVSKIEKLALDGIGALNLAVASAPGATISGSADADIVFGLAGNETLNGGAGNDILIGGAGNDTLVGGTGNDQYRFRAGDGADTIVESGAFNDNDELDFGAGIDWNELWFAQQGNNLVVSVLGTTDKVTISNWFAGPGNVVETIKSGDGKVLHSSDVATMVAAMAGFDPATSPTGSGIQPNDPRLGDPNQIGSISRAMQSSWLAA
jgi:Ca2+-binding RTX toxin-like protein